MRWSGWLVRCCRAEVSGNHDLFSMQKRRGAVARIRLKTIIQSRPTGADSGGRLVVSGGVGNKINLSPFLCPHFYPFLPTSQ